MKKLISAAASIAAAATPLPALAGPTKPTIVLVHGAFETAEVWGYVVAKLEKDGYKVKNIALPGRPGNERAVTEISLDLYQRTVASAIADETGPVVLVGHSFGGFTISAEAEAEPQKIKTLVYVAAYIPRNGDSLLSLATADSGSKLGPVLDIDKEHGLASVKPGAGGGVFASDGPQQVQDAVSGAVVAEPLAPLATPVTLTADRFGKVDKVAIRTLRDQVISTGYQATMIKATPVRLSLTIDTGHVPFLTQPDALAAEIEKAAG
ncbi:alpha/beta hydrolase [Sphingobium amiense]|uniref:Alpha/beta hydrolase n=1 Tax=Sphingobium amiense TaxID=135719 RepID=A0A494VX50_9SPHN|nr:alpha/beta fold hydrolase [Sphingobium amiense]BBD96973.1 alpha/beta hydrolase [Sphingobium amiense]